MKAKTFRRKISGEEVIFVPIQNLRYNGRPVTKWDARRWTDEYQNITYTEVLFTAPQRASEDQVVENYHECFQPDEEEMWRNY